GWVPFFTEPESERFTALATAAADILAYDAAGYHLVRIQADGTKTVIAGNGTRGSFGDGSWANGASFQCMGLALNGAGGIVLADPLNSRLAAIDSEGVINTVAGGPFDPANPLVRPIGLARGDDDSFYVADPGGNRVQQITAEG